MTFFQFTLTLLIVCASSVSVFWLLALVRIRKSVRSSISICEGLEEPEPKNGWPLVSVVIPLHNEAETIGQCANSLVEQQYPKLEVIFVLDRCTDESESILRKTIGSDDRFQLVMTDECPPDWAGKCNAARRGGERATGEYLVFTDADTEFSPQLIQASVALARREEADLLSILSTLSCRRWDERVVQPVAVLNLMRMYPIDQINRRERSRSFANGQFMLFSSSMYKKLGGHERVRDDLLEDVAFARAVASEGGRGIVALADGMLEVSMYDSLAAMRQGWKRIFIEVSRRRPSALRVWGLRLFLLAFVAPLVQVATLWLGIIAGLDGDAIFFWIAIISVLSGVVMQKVMLAWAYVQFGAPVFGIIGFPIGSFIVACAMFEGARDLARGRPIRWCGREYVLDPN